MEIILLTVIFLMAVYIAYLHVKLIKRDLRTDSLIKQLTGTGFAGRFSDFTSDRIFDENILKFILENEKEAKIYLHYTRLRETAENILREGFLFAESLYKTAFTVTSDRLDLMVKHNSKKYFGDYVVVICIADRIIRFYNSEIIKYGLKNCNFENIITEKPPEKNENAETVYILPSKYIKGIVNYTTGEIIRNNNFDPYYSSPLYEANLNDLRNHQSDPIR